MANSNRFLGPYNSFPPEAQGQLVGYMRDKSEFKLNDYVQLIEANDPVGFFWTLQPDQQIRMVSKSEWAWEPGADRPKGNANLSMFSSIDFATFRWCIPYKLDIETVQQARRRGGFDPEVVEAKGCASQMMTMRTQDVILLGQTAGNWGTNTADANALNGGAGIWTTGSGDENSPFYAAIQTSLMSAVQVINLQTNAKVQFKDLCLIVSPNDAIKIGRSAEVRNYIKYREGAKVVQEGGLANPNEQWGCPNTIYGIKLVVEDAPQVTVYQNADGTLASVSLGERSRVKTDGSAILCSRVGSIDAPFGTRNFSTFQIFWCKDEMTAESKADSWNRNVEGGVVSRYVAKIAAPASGFLITNIT